MSPHEPLLSKHGGYKKLKSFQVAELVYDVTVRFCDNYINKRSRTHDQMVQAARSGVQNIAEGSVDSGTSKKSEMKLTNIARGSLEELRRDYEDFLRQRELRQFPRDAPAMQRFIALRCSTLEQFRGWVADEVNRALPADAAAGQQSTLAAEFAANAALSLIYVATYLLGKQLAAQAKEFELHGGFTERMYRVRKERRGF